MERDNPGNILGVNTADNCYDSSNVVGNATGSMIERIAYMQSLVAAFTAGALLVKGVVDTAAPSTTNVKCAGLLGYGEDFFNNVFYMQVVRSGGAAPEPEVRKITNYVTATGTFTVDAFSDTVAAGDLIFILHESAVICGRPDADNVIDTSSVVANANGSIIERLAYLQTLSNTEIADILAAVDTEITTIMTETNKIPATITKIDGEVIKTAAIQADIGDPSARANFKSLEAMIGIPDAANSNLDDILRTGFDSSAIGNNEDGSALERLEGLKDRLTTVAGYIDTEIAAITTKLVKPAGNDVADATIADVVGTKADTTAGTSLVSLAKQIDADIGDASARTQLTSIMAMLGNPEVAGNSLWNALFVNGGLTTFPAAAVPAAGVALTQVVRDIWDSLRNGTGGSEPGSNLSILDVLAGSALSKNATNHIQSSITMIAGTTGAVGTHEVFTITGLVRLRMWIECTVNIAGSGTIEFGTATDTNAYILTTTGTDLDALDLWADETPTELDGNFSSCVFDKVVNDIDVGYEIKTDTLTGGNLTFHCVWEPMNATGAVVAADGTTSL